MDSLVLWQQAVQEWEALSFGLKAAVVTLFAVYALEIFLSARGLIVTSTGKRWKRAVKYGTPILATRTHYRQQYHETQTKSQGVVYTSTYEYELNGQTKRKCFATGSPVPETLTFYKLPHSNKVVSELDNSFDITAVFWALLPIISAVTVLNIFGGV